MTQLPVPIEAVLGFDVAQDSVTLHDLLGGRTLTVVNTHAALTAALRPFRNHRLAVCEATGGHEAVLLGVLFELAIPAHRADGGKISAFARSLRLAKTDRLDARMLAVYGRERGATLPRWVPPPAFQQELTALVRRRADLVAARKSERTRAKARGPRPSPPRSPAPWPSSTPKSPISRPLSATSSPPRPNWPGATRSSSVSPASARSWPQAC